MNIRLFVSNAIRYVVKKVILIAMALFGATLLTFIVTGRFSLLALSERLFWVSIFFFFVGGTVAMANVVSSRGMRFPFYFRKPEDAKNYMDNLPDYREQAEKRLDVGIQLFFIGLMILGFSALIEMLSR
jgi:hypothetical protein